MTDEKPPADKTPLDQAIELFVYAPVGIALTARDELPKLIERGQQQVTTQIAIARMLGQFAVAQGQKEAEKAVQRARQLAGELGLTLPGAPERGAQARPAPATSAAPAPTHAAAPEPARPDERVASDQRSASNGKAAARTTRPNRSGAAALTASDDDLAIPGYGALSASQVVQRLAGLSRDELEAVRAYEQSTRGRRTILSKISQLQADG